MSNNVANIKLKKCTGCYACSSVCPRDAIEMKMNAEGFFYPVIDETKCISCGLCKSSCPTLVRVKTNSPLDIQRGNAKELIARNSGSSGGVFGLLANTVMNMGGVVFGAAYSEEEKLIIHSNTIKIELSRLFKSKYVQSQICDSFKEIRRLLNEDTFVLFCGTPCQVAGLNHYLGKTYEKLITVDFMCHGVPSPGLFKKMIEVQEQNKGQSVYDIIFRDKINGWRKSTTTTTYANGDKESVQNRNSVFYQLFLNNYSLRASCYTCQYYKHHESDITLADDWQIPAHLDDDTGMSLIIVNSSQGRNWFNVIEPQLNHSKIEKTSFDFEFYKHDYSSKGRKAFFADYTTYGYETVMNKWSKKAYIKKISCRAKMNDTLRRVRKILHTCRNRK